MMPFFKKKCLTVKQRLVAKQTTNLVDVRKIFNIDPPLFRSNYLSNVLFQLQEVEVSVQFRHFCKY